MPDSPETRASKQGHNRRVHMANERTFLAWIRTSIAIMAFGFVVEKFSLFVKQAALYFGGKLPAPDTGGSSVVGIILVGLGLAMGVLAFIRYKIVERQIDEDTYQPSAILSILLLTSVFAVGVFLLLYLVHTL